MCVSTGKAGTPNAWAMTTDAVLCPTPGSRSIASKEAGTCPSCSSSNMEESFLTALLFRGASPCNSQTVPGEAAGAEGAEAAGEAAAGMEAGGGFALELCVLWLYLVFTLLQPAVMRSSLALCRTLLRDWRRRVLRSACLVSPLERIDEVLLGKKVGFAQQAAQSAGVRAVAVTGEVTVGPALALDAPTRIWRGSQCT